MFSFSAAIDAYRQSKYQNIEWDIQRRIGGDSIPIVGGIPGALGQFGNAMLRPLKVTGAFLFGFSSDPASVIQTEIPADIAHNQYGRDLALLRQTNREEADMRAEGYRHFTKLEFQRGFRQLASADHQAARAGSVVIPGDRVTTATRSGALGAVAGSALAQLSSGILYDGGTLARPHSGLPSTLGAPTADTSLDI
jgi:hypothetical protein